MVLYWVDMMGMGKGRVCFFVFVYDRRLELWK